MSDETRVEQLLDEVLDSNRSPEEVCADCPELLPEVRKRVEQMRLTEAELDALFPIATPDRDAGTMHALRQRVDRLLRAHVQAGGILDRPAVEQRVTTDYHPAMEVGGARIGPYKLLQQIGEGGFGVVYMAEQTEPVRRKVAVKIIKPGMDTKEVIARFESERQALALMDHPNIAKVLDAGATERGLPYFVMELVKGVPITEYCDNNNLSPQGRLGLFVTVCRAVQHAHQKGIIHRDLKPSNVMVTLHDGIPVPKVIDFGVAKATSQQLTERTLFTAYGQMIGTPAYMSPEQAEMSGLDIDTQSDIYALGVLLYELLTGSTPFDSKRLRQAGYAEMLRIIREEEPPRPSTRLTSLGDSATVVSSHRSTEPKKLAALLRGDLDWIVMKALEKDRNRRYETANGLARDVERYLNDETVQACPPSARYRLRKFARRNKAVLATAAVVAASLVIGTVAATWQAVRATKAEGLAQVRLETANANYEEAERQRQSAKTQEGLARGQELLARRRLYASQTNLAYEAWKKGQTARVLELLESQRPQAGQEDLRSFDWYFLWNLGRRGARQVLRGPRGQVLTLAFAPGGKTLAAGDSNGGLTLWDVTSGKERRALPRQAGPLLGLAYSPDGKSLAAAGFLDVVRLWDPESGKQLAEWKRSSLLSLAFGADGKTLAAGSRNGMVSLWDVRTRQERAVLRGMPEPSYVNVALSPDGKRLAAANDWSETPRTLLWDLTISPPRVAYRLPGAVSVAFSPDSQTLALAGNGKLRLVNVANGKEKLLRETDSGNIKALAFSPDGRTLAFGSDDQTVRLWNLSSGQERRYSHGAPIDCLAFSPDGTMVASGGKDETVKFWDVSWEPDAASLRHPGPVTAVAFSPDGSLIATGSADTVTLWHVNEQRAVVRLKLSTGKVRAGLVFSHDGNTLAVAGGHTIKLFHTDRWQEKATLEGHAFDVYNLAFSPDDRTLASSEGPTTDVAEVKLWDVASGRARFTMRRKTTGSPIAFSADGRLLATGWGHVFYLPAGLTLVDVATGQERLTLSSGIPAVARAVAFSPDGTTVALVISWGQIFLWDVHTSKLRNCLKGHTGDIDSIAFHPDGKILASTNRDGSISLWDLATGQERMVLTGHAGGANSVAFSPDGATMASAGDDGVVKLWQGPVSREARAPKVEPDPLLVWPPPTGDLDQWAEQLARRLRKVVDEPPDQAQQTRRQLAQKYLDLSQRFLNARRYPEAVEASSKVLQLTPNAPEPHNNLAWLLATCPDARFRDPKRAVELAMKAVELAPEDGNSWNTLGVANSRAGDWNAAVRALKKSNELLRGNGLSFNAFFLSMAEWQLGNKDEARKWYDQAVQWMEKNQPQNEELRRFRAEAAEILKIEKQANSR